MICICIISEKCLFVSHTHKNKIKEEKLSTTSRYNRVTYIVNTFLNN